MFNFKYPRRPEKYCAFEIQTGRKMEMLLSCIRSETNSTLFHDFSRNCATEKWAGCFFGYHL